MESYDSWVLNDAYDILGVNKSLKEVEKKELVLKTSYLLQILQ